MSSKLKLLLVVSLILNILLIGFVAGQKSHHFRYFGHNDPHWKALEQVSDDNKALVKQTFREIKQQNKSMHKQIKQLRQEIVAVLKTEPFDKQEFLAKTQQMHELRGEMASNMAEQVAETAEKLPVEDRKALLKFMRPSHGRK